MSFYYRSFSFSFSHLIPNEQPQYLVKEVKKIKRYIKFWRRWLLMKFSHQLLLEQNTIPTDAKNILWINTTAPSLGDSLMDLAGRILLKDKNIDLYTSAKNSILYRYDPIFCNVYDNVEQLKKSYDLIIIDSFSPRSMKIKTTFYKNTPFVGMYGFLNGFDIHRTLFSYYRMSELLSRPFPENHHQIRPIIGIQQESLPSNIPSNFITIAIGGEWDFRTYSHWSIVIKELINHSSIILIGSKNGEKEALKLTKIYPSLINTVGKLSLNQTSLIIEKCFIMLCADGGLLHIANALHKPTISLFGGILPSYRHTLADIHRSLYDPHNVSSIDPQDVISTYFKLKENL